MYKYALPTIQRLLTVLEVASIIGETKHEKQK